jgi:hypothetical protein
MEHFRRSPISPCEPALIYFWIPLAHVYGKPFFTPDANPERYTAKNTIKTHTVNAVFFQTIMLHLNRLVIGAIP